MSKTLAEVKVLLLETLDELIDDDFRGFKWHLVNFTEIPESRLETADRRQTVNLMVNKFPSEAEDKTIAFLRSINRNDLVQRLSHNNAGESQT